MRLNIVNVFSSKRLWTNSTELKIAVSCLVGSALICLIASFIGQFGMEGVLRFDLNWGSKYDELTNSKETFSSGIFRYLAIPVFDGSQHLGIRLPNLGSNYTLHPLVFLSSWISTQTLTQLFVFLNIFFLFYFIAITFKSWDLKYWKTLTLFSSFALSGELFIFIIHNDAGAFVGVFCGIFSLITVLVDKSFYSSKLRTSDLYRLLAKLLFVFGALVTSHPRGFFIAIPLFILSAIRFVNLRPDPKHSLKIVSVLISMSIISLVYLADIKENSTDQIRFGSGSLFDFFQPQRISSVLIFVFYISSAVFVSALQPIFWFLELTPHITSRSDFFAWPLLAGVFLFSLKRKKFLTKPVLSLCRNIGFLFLGYLLSSILVGLVSKNKVLWLTWLIRADGWDYAITLFGIVVISSPILLFASIQKSDRISDFKFWKQSPVVTSLLIVGAVVSVLYPIVSLLKAPSVVASASYEQLKNSDQLSIVERVGLRENRRFIFLKSAAFEGRRGLSSMQRGWLPILGIPHPLVLSRNGYPTPAGSPSYQDPGTLSDDFFTYTEFYGNECSPRLYDFLGIDTVIADFLDSGCTEDISRYLNSATEIQHFQPEICYGLKTCLITTRIGDLDFSGLSIAAIRPMGFHSFYLTKFSNHTKTVCALENFGCLANLQTNQELSLDRNPLKFCEESCWINYDYQIPEDAQFLVIPINFDPSISVINKYTKQVIKAENLQGLVGVRLDSNQRSGTLEINIVADTKMKVRVVATYLHLFLFAYLIILLFKIRVEVSVEE